MEAWFLLYCDFGKNNNKDLIRLLEGFDVEVFQPMLNISKARKDRPGKFRKKNIPLFENYLFVRFDYSHLRFSQILCLSGVSYFVRSSNQLATIPVECISQLKKASNDVIEGVDYNNCFYSIMCREINSSERIGMMRKLIVYQDVKQL